MTRMLAGRAAALAALLVAANVAGCDTVPAEEDVFSISGTIAYRERIALPADSNVRVILAEVAATGKPAAEIGEFAVKTGGEQVPIPFRITVDRAELDALGRYAVAAAIGDPAGTLIWKTETAQIVDTGPAKIDVGTLPLVRVAAPAANANGNAAMFDCGGTHVGTMFRGDTLTLTVAGGTYTLTQAPSGSGARYTSDTARFWEHQGTATLAIGEREYPPCTKVGAAPAAAATAAAGLTGGDWVVEDIAGRGIVDSSRVTMTFGANGDLSGSTGCNGYGGSYKSVPGDDGATLEIGMLALSQRACVAAIGNHERAFLAVLNGATGYRIDATGALIVTAKDGKTILARR